MYNSRTFSQKYQLFIVKNVIDSKINPSEECATTENKPKIIQQPL